MPPSDLPSVPPADCQPTLPPLTLPLTDAQLHLRLALHPSLSPPLPSPVSVYTGLLNACFDPSLHTRSINLTPQPAELAAAVEPPPACAPAHEPAQPTITPSAPLICSDTIDELGKHALERCVPPPHRVPAPTDTDTLAGPVPRPAKPPALALITPWRTFTPLPDVQPYTLPPRSPADAHRRGFWFIPIWKRRVGPDDFFATFANAISLPSWAQPPLSQPDPALEGYAQPPIHWTPARLRAFWKILSHICTQGTIGNISAVAVILSHAQDTLPTRSPLDPPPASTAVQDQFGDHIRVWSDLDSALQLRRVFSDLSLSLVPPQTSQPVSEEESRYKWLKKCVLMWFDESGQPRGYG